MAQSYLPWGAPSRSIVKNGMTPVIPTGKGLPAGMPPLLRGWETNLAMGRKARPDGIGPIGGNQGFSTATGGSMASPSGYGGRGSYTSYAPSRGPVPYRGGAQPAGTFIPESKYGQGMGRIPFRPQAPIIPPPAAANLFAPNGVEEDSLIFGDASMFRAKGGPVDKVQPYIVGEEGPELFIPKVDGKIIPHKKTVEMLKPKFRATGGYVQGYEGYEEDDYQYDGRPPGYTGNRYISQEVFRRNTQPQLRGIGNNFPFTSRDLNPASGPVQISTEEIYRRYPWAPRSRQGLESFVDLTRQQAANNFARQEAGRAAVQQAYANQKSLNDLNNTGLTQVERVEAPGYKGIFGKYGDATATYGQLGIESSLSAYAPNAFGPRYQAPVAPLAQTDPKTAAMFDDWRQAEGLPRKNPMNRLKKKS